MAARRRQEPQILLPWERSGGALLRFRTGRARPIAFGLVLLCVLVWFGAREREQARERRTREALLRSHRAVERYLAANEGQCPPSLDAAVQAVQPDARARDGWGRPLEFACPPLRGEGRYELSSAGPDGLPGGLDRVE